MMSEDSLRPDIPIRNFDEDKLGRANFARALARVLLSYNRPESLVIGLYGAWGLGKTSLLNLALLAASESAAPIIVRFDPWYFSGTENLIRQFFNAMSIALGKQGKAENYRRTADLLQGFADGIESLSAIPGAAAFTKPTSFALRLRGRKYEKLAASAQSLDDVKVEISKLLAEGGRRVVVIMDDIDRLPADEIRAVFRLVKGLADFEHVTYLLAFDENVVARVLADVQGGNGHAYLEKIVNGSVRVPPISPQRIAKLTLEALNVFLQTHPALGLNDDDRRRDALVLFLSKRCCTLRDIVRLSNALHVDVQTIAGEVDGMDFIAITALRVLLPSLYAFVRDNREMLIDTDAAYFQRQRLDPIARTEVERQLADVPNREETQDLLVSLLPRLGRILGNVNHSDSERSGWRMQRRLCEPDSFDVYFQFDLSSEDISRQQMEGLLGKLWDETFFRSTLQGFIDDSVERGLAFLRRLQDHVADPRVTSQAGILVKVLFDLGDRFPQDIRGFPFRLDGETLIMQIVAQVLRRVDSAQARFEALGFAINEAVESLAPLVTTISVEDGEHGRFAVAVGRAANPERQLVDDSDLDLLERAARQKIEQWAEGDGGGRLARHPRLALILFRWADWGGRDIVQNYILRSLNPSDFCRLLAQLAMQGRSPIAPPILERQHTDALADFGSLRQRLSAILSGPDRQLVAESDLQVLEQIAWQKPSEETGNSQ